MWQFFHTLHALWKLIFYLVGVFYNFFRCTKARNERRHSLENWFTLIIIWIEWKNIDANDILKANGPKILPLQFTGRSWKGRKKTSDGSQRKMEHSRGARCCTNCCSPFAVGKSLHLKQEVTILAKGSVCHSIYTVVPVIKMSNWIHRESGEWT